MDSTHNLEELKMIDDEASEAGSELWSIIDNYCDMGSDEIKEHIVSVKQHIPSFSESHTKSGMLNANEFLNWLNAHPKEVPNEVVAGLKAVFETYGNEFGMGKVWIGLDVMSSLAEGEKPPEEKVDIKLKKQMSVIKDAFFGVSKMDMADILDDWNNSIISVDVFSRARTITEVCVGVFAEEKKTLNESPVSDENLSSQGSRLVSMMKTNVNEGIKLVYLLGSLVLKYRTGRYTWLRVETLMGWSKSHLHHCLDLFRFFEDYPRFLRVTVPYTTILRNIKQIRSTFKVDTRSAQLWADFDA